MSRRRIILRRLFTRPMAWDLFMVYLAAVNLTLIVFDWSYLWLRPFCLRNLPVVTRLYDPVKGIEPHPVTERLLELTAELASLGAAGAPPSAQEPLLAELRELSAAIAEDNPFERSGQETSLIRMTVQMRDVLDSEGPAVIGSYGAAQVMQRFWALEPGSPGLDARLALFSGELAPLLEVNYLRRYRPSGRLTDHFWLIDLPFLLVFATEFFTRWILSVRRSTYSRWFFFPVFNWYDLLGIVPVRGLRIFRLFRIASIYLRLQRSEHTVIGDDIISRGVKAVVDVISEEISDMVAIRILNETQDELRDGRHTEIIRSVAGAHRDALAAQLATHAGELLASPRVRARAREFLDANLEHAVDSSPTLRGLPLPNAALRPLVRSIGETVFDAIFETLAATLASEEGQRELRSVIADVVDGLVEEATEGELEVLAREVSLQVLEQMKEAVAVRKWALPDRPPRRVLTTELGRD